MHVGLVMECDYRPGRTQEEAFEEAFSIAEMADELGLDGVWLAERHFAAPRQPDTGQTLHGASEVDPQQGTRIFHDGSWYYFCGLDCRTKFLASPTTYLEQSGT